MNSFAQPSLSNGTLVETIREDTGKSPLQLNTNDEKQNTDTSDDYEYLSHLTSMEVICSQTVKYIPQSAYSAETRDRVGISECGPAHISTSLLDDLEVMQQNYFDNIIDRRLFIRCSEIFHKEIHISLLST